jgi:hypothetical protein
MSGFNKLVRLTVTQLSGVNVLGKYGKCPYAVNSVWLVGSSPTVGIRQFTHVA